jgi:uncharacterized membrane protein YecN with MAPEG domain
MTLTYPLPVITALYAALQGIVMIALLIPLGRLRGQTNVSLYDGGNPELGAAIRRHANWTEFVPYALLMLLLLELLGASPLLLHGLGLTLLLARILHPFGLDPVVMRRPLRAIGAAGTMIVITVEIVALLIEAL